MQLTIEFSEYKPWSGAIDAYNRIYNEDKMDAFEALCTEVFGEIARDVDINDLLWHESDEVYRMLEISDDDEEDEEDEELCGGDDGETEEDEE